MANDSILDLYDPFSEEPVLPAPGGDRDHPDVEVHPVVNDPFPEDPVLPALRGDRDRPDVEVDPVVNVNADQLEVVAADQEPVGLNNPFPEEPVLPVPAVVGRLVLNLNELPPEEEPNVEVVGDAVVNGGGVVAVQEHVGLNNPALPIHIITKRVTDFQLANQLPIPSAVRNRVTLPPGQPPNSVTVHFQRVEGGVLVAGQPQPLLLHQTTNGNLVTARRSWANFQNHFDIEQNNRHLVFYSLPGPLVNRFGLGVLAD